MPRMTPGGNPVNASDMHQEIPQPEHMFGPPGGRAALSPKPGRAGPRHPALRGFGALAVAICSVALVSACASPAPSARVAVATSPPPPAATAVTPDTTGPPNTAPPGGASSSPAPAGRTGTAGPGPAVPRCKNLDVGLTGGQPPHKDRSGHYQYPIRLTVTNLGKASCSVYGYPGLGLLDASHHALPPSHTHWGSTYFARDPGPSLIVLAYLQSADANISLGWRPTPWATYLEITPPNEYHHDLISIGDWLETAGIQGGLGGDLTATAMAPAPKENCKCL
jgi:hypothetical protein